MSYPVLLVAVLLLASYCCSCGAATGPKQTSPTRRLLQHDQSGGAAPRRSLQSTQVVSELGSFVGVMGVAAANGSADASVCASTYQQADVRPLREQWTGYGGELAVQTVALTRSVWVSQRQARIIGTGSETTPLLLQPRSAAGMLRLMRDKLLFSLNSTTYWDSLNQTVTGGNASNPTGVVSPSAASYLGWVKQQVMTGRPVITGLRLNGSAGATPSFYYDQVATVFGVCTSSTSATNVLNNASDSFTITGGNGAETNRSASDPKLYSKWQECPYQAGSGDVGCIPSDIFSYGLSVGDLTDLGRISLRTTKLTITGWSDGTPATQEPAGSATARYALQVWGLQVGRTYRTYRIQGLLGGTTLPTSKAALEVMYQSRIATSRKLSFVANAPSMVLTRTQLGEFPANSVQTFITALWV